MIEPKLKRVVTFFDIQNFYLTSKNAWGCSYPDFDPVALSILTTSKHADWKLTGIKLYTGIHSIEKNERWHKFWTNKLNFHKEKDSRVSFYTTLLHYSGGCAHEKGIDIRIALDLVRMARTNDYDIALLFSSDSDFCEVAGEIRAIAKEKDRWIKIVSVFPDALKRGIDKTDWLPLSKDEYDKCTDTNNYLTDIPVTEQPLC
ncbi:MAG: NYN domain-containing protein [Synergistaceae bacterium]|nr:NYN domain-containing protein [Candidatus Equadaptatus faecalis]